MLQNIVLILVACFLLAFFLVVFFVMLSLFVPWVQAFVSGAPVPLIALIGMKLRKIDVSLVLKCLILARQSGVPLTIYELQQAYLRGVDLEKLTLAHVESQKQQLGLSFEELVELDLKDRLAEKLKR